MEYWLPVIWFGVIGFGVLMYVLLDGFVLGLGILAPFAEDEHQLDHMMNTAAPIWDGNETWLVLGGAGLLAAFPKAYALILSALYLPVLLMLVALVFRGVAFEFRFKAERSKWMWGWAFALGSLCAAFWQGVILGAIVEGMPLQEGKYAAETVLKWIKDNGKTDIKVFAVSGGDPTQEWAQGRMISFEETIKAAIPDATFVTGAANGLNTSYEPGQTYDVYRSFLTANPNVQFIENVDIGAEHAGRAIESLGLVGKVFTVGWNSSLGQLDAIEKGIQVAQFDQRWPDQAGFGAVACAAFLKNGEILPNTQTLKAVLADGVEQARAELNNTMGQ